ncbi:MAG: hypothetical protein ACXVDA_07810 [Ktedonobacterales bacterium]
MQERKSRQRYGLPRRGFFAQQYSPGDPQSIIAALEAVVGLVIEISFIATFTKRFFGQ